MKAVILAGGAGTRLQPLTTELPKPMVSLLGRPVLEHILLLLRRHQVTEAAVTLHYHPEAITGYFGDGSAWGMRLHYFYEDTPLGTAGGVRACRDFLGQEDFLVISGDCVSDFDLTDCYRLHRQRQAEATLLLHRVAEPLEYGLVRTDQEGRVLAFVEKPGWGQVFTDQVNTGIYLLSPSVLDLVPEGEPFDFSKNLFPELLRQKRALYGQVPAGYWRDMGECGSYLQTVEDALEGRVKLDMTLPQQSTGVWSAEPVPDSVEVLAPCWIGSDVTLAPWSSIGPHTVLEPGSTVGRGCRLRRTVVMGASVGAESQVEGAILCSHAKIGEGGFLYPGSVVGADTWLGDHATLRPQVRLWPGLHIQAGSLVVEVLGQRAEHQNAVNALVLVERTDVVHQLLLARVLGQHDLTDRDADLLAALERAALIGQIVLARTHAQNGKAGLRAVFLQLLRLLTQLFGQRPGGVGPLE